MCAMKKEIWAFERGNLAMKIETMYYVMKDFLASNKFVSSSRSVTKIITINISLCVLPKDFY
jgi:hypothetical protein